MYLGVAKISNNLSEFLNSHSLIDEYHIDCKLNSTGIDTFIVVINMGQLAHAKYMADLLTGDGKSLKYECQEIIGKRLNLQLEIVVNDIG